MFTYLSVYLAYMQTNPFTRMVWVDGQLITETGHCMSVANHKQLDRIFRYSTTIEDVIEHMKSCVGCIGNTVPSLED